MNNALLLIPVITLHFVLDCEGVVLCKVQQNHTEMTCQKNFFESLTTYLDWHLAMNEYLVRLPKTLTTSSTHSFLVITTVMRSIPSVNFHC